MTTRGRPAAAEVHPGPGRARPILPLTFEKRETHLLALLQVRLGHPASQGAHAPDVVGALGHADRPPRVQDIEGMGALQAIVVGRKDQAALDAVRQFKRDNIVIVGYDATPPAVSTPCVGA